MKKDKKYCPQFEDKAVSEGQEILDLKVRMFKRFERLARLYFLVNIRLLANEIKEERERIEKDENNN